MAGLGQCFDDAERQKPPWSLLTVPGAGSKQLRPRTGSPDARWLCCELGADGHRSVLRAYNLSCCVSAADGELFTARGCDAAHDAFLASAEPLLLFQDT